MPSKSDTLDSKKSLDDLNINNKQLSTEKEKKRINTLKSLSTFKYDLIHNDTKIMNLEIIRKNSFKFIIISTFLILIKELSTKIIFDLRDIFDYYFFNLIIISIILRAFLKEKIYNHQILSIVFV